MPEHGGLVQHAALVDGRLDLLGRRGRDRGARTAAAEGEGPGNGPGTRHHGCRVLQVDRRIDACVKELDGQRTVAPAVQVVVARIFRGVGLGDVLLQVRVPDITERRRRAQAAAAAGLRPGRVVTRVGQLAFGRAQHLPVGETHGIVVVMQAQDTL